MMGMPGGMPLFMNQGRGPAMMQMPMQPGMPGGQPGMMPLGLQGQQMGFDMHIC